MPPQQGGWAFLSAGKFRVIVGCLNQCWPRDVAVPLAIAEKGFQFWLLLLQRLSAHPCPAGSAERGGEVAVARQPSPVGAASSAHSSPLKLSRQSGHSQGSTQSCCSLFYWGSSSRTGHPVQSTHFPVGGQLFKRAWPEDRNRHWTSSFAGKAVEEERWLPH